TEAYRQLNDTKYYRKISSPIHPLNRPKITAVLTDMLKKSIISHKQFLFLTRPTKYKPRQFYLLPKIHKEPDKWTIPASMPRRYTPVDTNPPHPAATNLPTPPPPLPPPSMTRSSAHLIRLLALTMYNNGFEFNGDFFLHTCGVAMGKKFAPALANLFLISLD